MHKLFGYSACILGIYGLYLLNKHLRQYFCFSIIKINQSCMRKILLLTISAGLIGVLLTTIYNPVKWEIKYKNKISGPAKSDTFIIIAWNDLGMHCANKYFGTLCVLPPYNNQHAQVIKKGSALTLPQILTGSYHVTYEIPGNTYSVGKTDFWTYVDTLFGVTLPNNIGLTGVGLSGNMDTSGNYFHVEGIPVTPYPDNDLINEHPYQLTLIKLFDQGDNFLSQTQSVIPVSNELSCVSTGCHSSEQNILNRHEAMTGFAPNVKPILCANCHRDNALGKPGTAGTPAFSEAVHLKHGGITNNCYKCHPGPITQCFRDIMFTNSMICQDCHGSVTNVGQTIENGRQDWLEEPNCGIVACHGPQHSAEPGKLYRNSKGHAGLYCSACHGSPHAIFLTNNANDNLQNVTLQGYAGTLNKCVVCHGVNPTGAGPHGLHASIIEYNAVNQNNTELLDAFPNPANESTNISFITNQKHHVMLEIIDNQGKRIKLLIDQHLEAGKYTVKLNSSDIASGIYFYVLHTDKQVFTKKIVVTG